MSDHDTITPEADDEIRSRLQAFARHVAQHADTEAALRQMPRRSRPPTIRLIAIAACAIAVVGLAAVILADRQSVSTDPADSPTQTTDVPTTLARGVVQFVEAPVPEACCIPPGGGLGVPAGGGLGGQTLDITAEEADGLVTGEARFRLIGFLEQGVADIVVEFGCADTDTDDVLLGGVVTTRSGDGVAIPDVGVLMALIIREGEPDSATVWWDIGGEAGVSSCGELLEAVPEPRPDGAFVDIVEGDDIETG